MTCSSQSEFFISATSSSSFHYHGPLIERPEAQVAALNLSDNKIPKKRKVFSIPGNRVYFAIETLLLEWIRGAVDEYKWQESGDGENLKIVKQKQEQRIFVK